MQKRHRFDSEPLCKTALGAAPPEIKTAALKIRVPTRQVNYRAHCPGPNSYARSPVPACPPQVPCLPTPSRT